LVACAPRAPRPEAGGGLCAALCRRGVHCVCPCAAGAGGAAQTARRRLRVGLRPLGAAPGPALLSVRRTATQACRGAGHVEGGCSTAGLHVRSGLRGCLQAGRGSHTCECRSAGRACTRKVAPKHRPCSCQVGSGCLVSKRRLSHACSRRRVNTSALGAGRQALQGARPPGCPCAPASSAVAQSSGAARRRPQ